MNKSGFVLFLVVTIGYAVLIFCKKLFVCLSRNWKGAFDFNGMYRLLELSMKRKLSSRAVRVGNITNYFRTLLIFISLRIEHEVHIVI